jgi:hypothetical protein
MHKSKHKSKPTQQVKDQTKQNDKTTKTKQPEQNHLAKRQQIRVRGGHQTKAKPSS